MSGARPGWYPDPAGGPGGRYRWWDGEDWTKALGDSPQAPEPSRAHPVRRSMAARSSVRTATTWTIGVALLAVAGVVLGLVIWQEPTRSADDAAAGGTPRPSATGVPGELDRDNRAATVGNATMTLPADPYVVRADAMRATNLFDSYFVSGATVHEDYRDRRDWSAVVGLAHVSPIISRGDPEATASAVIQGMASRFFDGRQTALGELSIAEHSVDGCSGVLVTADVSYEIAGLPSHADQVTVVVVRLDDGTEVAAFSSVPTSATRAIRDQAAASLDSLHID